MKHVFLFLTIIFCVNLSAQENTDEVDFFVTTENDSSFHIKPVEVEPRLEKTLFILNGNSVDESILKTINRKLIKRAYLSSTDTLLSDKRYDAIMRIHTKEDIVINAMNLEEFTEQYLSVSAELVLYSYNDKIIHEKANEFTLDVDNISTVEVEKLRNPKPISFIHIYSRDYKLADQEFIFIENKE